MPRVRPHTDKTTVSSLSPTPVLLPETRQSRANELHPDVERLIVGTRERRRRRSYVPRDRAVSYGLAAGFAAASLGLLAASHGVGRANPLTVVFYVCLYALVSRVRFEVGIAASVPVELVFVPMLFALPPALVPWCVAAGFILHDPVALFTGRVSVARIALRLVSAFHAIGPAVVLAIFVSGAARPPSWSSWPVYLLALGAQFAVDFVVSRARERALGHRRPLLQSVTLVYAVDAALAPIGLLAAFAAVDHAALVLLVLPLVGLMQLFAREREQRIDAALELGHAYRGTAMLLGDVVEADDAYTGEHSRDVVGLTLAVAARLRLDGRERRTAEFVALLHDIGKIRIPAEIINKPGPLDPDERKVIETHTVEGEAMLTKVGGLLGEVGSIVRSCHERWDGTGYPDRLKGDGIPLIARIVCCTDAYSAMTTDRPYRAAMSQADAVAELERCAGTHFDPEIVDAVVAVTR
jgi:HD-GYP domain-containing protein (c-di-GMP phosphodiesterase class II)